MHSKKVSVIIGIVILIIDVFLFIIYWHNQAKYTFEFIKGLVSLR